MKFLLDVCVSSRSLTSYLVDSGHDVRSAYDLDASASDQQILDFALNESRILITLDKDFGEIAFAHHRPHGPIIRFVELTIEEQVRAIDELLSQNSEVLTDETIVTLSRGRIRIRCRTK